MSDQPRAFNCTPQYASDVCEFSEISNPLWQQNQLSVPIAQLAHFRLFFAERVSLVTPARLVRQHGEPCPGVGMSRLHGNEFEQDSAFDLIIALTGSEPRPQSQHFRRQKPRGPHMLHRATGPVDITRRD